MECSVKMSLKLKLYGIFIFAFLVYLALGSYAVGLYHQVNQRMEHTRSVSEQVVLYALKTQVDFKKQVQEWNNILLRGHDNRDYVKYTEAFFLGEMKTQESALVLHTLLHDEPLLRKAVEKFLVAHRQLGRQYREALPVFKLAQNQPHITTDKYVRGIDRPPTELLSELAAMAQARFAKKLLDIELGHRQTERNLLLGAAAITLLLLLALGVAMGRIMLQPLSLLNRATQRITGGDYSHRVDLSGKDELAQLGDSFNRMSSTVEASQRKLLDALEAQTSLADELSSAHGELQLREAQFRGVVENITEAIITVDARGQLVSANAAAEKMLRLASAEVGDNNLLDFLKEPHRSRFAGYMREYHDTGHCAVLEEGSQEVLACRRDGSVFFMELGVSDMAVEGENRFIVYARDVSERKKQEERLRLLANYDTLTGLPNRHLFCEQLKAAMARSDRHQTVLAVLFIDLDGFKRINDTMGHRVGDELLREVAARMQGMIRSADTLARLGGDEFTLLIEELKHVDGAEVVARKIIDVMQQPIRLREHEVVVTPSIGITLYPFGSENVDDLLREADVAMYKAKEGGRNGYRFYHTTMDQATRHLIALESDLRRAVKEEQLTLFYQPKVDLQRGCVSGVEALVRWHHPQRGLVPPMEFIPLLEESGMIIAAGEQLLRQACLQWRQWRTQGYDVSMAVNLSSRQFDDPLLVDKVAAVIEETGMQASSLELEVTESAIMRDLNTSRGRLQALADMGVSIAIDDFGTGHSSLAYLKRFPVKVLKIDRSFVKDLVHSSDDQAITAAILGMAESLGLQVVAEGAEDRDQVNMLATRGCHLIQGFYFSPAVTAREVEVMLAQGVEYVASRAA